MFDFDTAELKSDAISILAIVGVVAAVFCLLVDDLDRTEYATMISVAVFLLVFEVGRHIDRYNRRKSEPRRHSGWCSVGRVRVLVAFFAATLMMVLYSKRFDADEWIRIGAMASVFGTYEAYRVIRGRLADLPPEARRGLMASISQLKSAFFDALGKALGTGFGAAIIGGIGWLSKPYLMMLLVSQ